MTTPREQVTRRDPESGVNSEVAATKADVQRTPARTRVSYAMVLVGVGVSVGDEGMERKTDNSISSVPLAMRMRADILRMVR
jgi:hypothetical protein